MQKYFWIIGLLFLVAAPARAQDSAQTPPESDPHGAVLCIWGIYVELKNYETVCSIDPKNVAGQVIDESIANMDKFITVNSDITQSQLDDKKAALLKHDEDQVSEVSKEELQKTCTDTGKNVMARAYQKIAADPAKVRKQIADLLSIPRKPVMNPCM